MKSSRFSFPQSSMSARVLSIVNGGQGEWMGHGTYQTRARSSLDKLPAPKTSMAVGPLMNCSPLTHWQIVMCGMAAVRLVQGFQFVLRCQKYLDQEDLRRYLSSLVEHRDHLCSDSSYLAIFHGEHLGKSTGDKQRDVE